MYKVRYMRLNPGYSNNNSGAITIASNLIYNEINEYPVALEFGVAFTNPHDMFVKKIGRGIAVERMNDKSSRYYVNVPLRAGRKLYYHELDQIIETYIGSILASPSWVKNFVLEYNWG